MIIEGKELIIKRYEFNEYMEVSIDGQTIIFTVDEVSYFLSNEMTNHLLNLKDEHYGYLYNLVMSKIS